MRNFCRFQRPPHLARRTMVDGPSRPLVCQWYLSSTRCLACCLLLRSRRSRRRRVSRYAICGSCNTRIYFSIMANNVKLHHFSLNNGKWDSFLWEMGLLSHYIFLIPPYAWLLNVVYFSWQAEAAHQLSSAVHQLSSAVHQLFSAVHQLPMWLWDYM
jgi:hypothetical protein